MSKFFDHLAGALREFHFDFGRAMRLRHEAELLATPVMPSGDDWSKATKADDAPEPELPEGVSESGGRYFADCCRCERECDVSEWIGTDETDDIDFTQWFGGCSERCCP